MHLTTGTEIIKFIPDQENKNENKIFIIVYNLIKPS